MKLFEPYVYRQSLTVFIPSVVSSESDDSESSGEEQETNNLGKEEDTYIQVAYGV